MRSSFLFHHPGRRHRLIVIVAAAAVVGSLVPAATASAEAGGPGQQPVQWGACDWYSSDFGGPVPECATVSVPRDWANPQAGPTLTIAISRTRASDPAHRKGVLFTNPGGPSGAGSVLSWLIAVVQPKVAAEYDIIGMDPRGVGDSTQLTCDVPVDQLTGLGSYDSRDLSDEAVAARQTVSKVIADSCAKNPLTRYVNTWQTTHDMDRIRAVLGEDKLNYLGYSYGTWLGAKYAALFPARAGRVVLDSNTSWMDDLAVSWELMPMAFQRRWESQFVPWATRIPAFSRYLGTTPAQVNAVYEQDRAAFSRYLASPAGGDFLDAVLRSSLYTDSGFFSNGLNLGVLKACLVDNTDWSPAGIQTCGEAFIAQLDKDLGGEATQQFPAELQASILSNPTTPEAQPDNLPSIVAAARVATGTTVPINGVFYAVRCGDGGQWHNPSWWANYARKFGPTYPLAGYAIPQEVCSFWTVPSQRLPNPDAHRLGPIVVVQSEFDPATAYENAVRDVQQFHGGRLISVDDAGAHGQYGIRGNGCVDDAVNAYLLDDVVPPDRSTCGALPLILENTVYPVDGPADGQTRPRSPRAVLVNPQLRRHLDRLIK